MRSVLRTGPGDTDGGSQIGKTKLICYLSSFRQLERSVKVLWGNLAHRVHQKTNLACSVLTTSNPVMLFRVLPGTEGGNQASLDVFLFQMCVCMVVLVFYFSVKTKTQNTFSSDPAQSKPPHLEFVFRIFTPSKTV